MEERITWFRTQVGMHCGGRPGRGARYPEELRCEAIEIGRELLNRGGPMSSTARRLGLAPGTLERWLEQEEQSGLSASCRRTDLRPVELIEAEEPGSEMSSPGAGLVLVTAAGHRVEGLGLDEVAVLLEALG
jgi:transposase-like protein